MKVLWLGGWAIYANEFMNSVEKNWPFMDHRYVVPARDWASIVSKNEFDVLIGYSLGSHLIIKEKIYQFIDKPIYLLAPFFDLKIEAQLGGKISITQIKYLLKWIKREPLAAINDFYSRAGLDDNQNNSIPYKIEDLIWGLNVILAKGVDLMEAENCKFIIGENDALIDSKFFLRKINNIKNIIGASHNYKTLLSHIEL